MTSHKPVPSVQSKPMSSSKSPGTHPVGPGPFKPRPLSKIITIAEEELDSLIKTGSEPANEPEVGPRFEIIDNALAKSYYLVKQKSTRNARWVLAIRIRNDGAAIAFYDADPTWLPPST